jgi:hypothetical protein
MVRRAICIATFFACFSVFAAAADRATFIMRDGSRQSGTIASVSPSGENIIGMQFHIITDNGQQVSFPTSQVAAIDFAGGTPSQSEVNELPTTSGENFLVLRNGTGQTGKLEQLLRGDTLSWINDAGQKQQYAIHDVARVYFDVPAARTAMNLPTPTGAVGTTGTVAQPGAVQVQANQQWTDTGVTVKKGDRVAFQTSGEIRWGQSPDQTAGPDGNGSMRNPAYPVPVAAVGALIGRVGNSAPFPIGSNNQPIVMPADGRLYLGVNDNEVGDNSGAFSVIVSKR